MKFLLKLAFKNLTRYYKRTLITASAIAFGLMLFIFVDGMLVGIDRDSERNLVWYETSSARIMTPEYFDEIDKLPMDDLIEDPDPILGKLEGMGIEAAPRISFSGEIFVSKDPYPEDGSMRVKMMAIDPEKDREVFRLVDAMEEGRYLESGKLEVVLGAWLAEDIGAEIGYPMTLVTRTRDNVYQTIEVTVAGTVNTTNPIVNRTALYLPLDIAEEYLEMRGAVTEINLSIPDYRDIDLEQEKLNTALAGFPEVNTYTWKDLAADFLAISAAKRSSTSMILFLVFIIAAVGISNTMLMAIFERTRELGMMRALGMKDKQIMAAFMLEAGGIGLIGSVIGVILGVLANWPMVEFGINFSFLLRDLDIGYRITGIMRSVWNPPIFVVAFVSGFVISMFVAIFPTIRALKMKITQCLRDE